MTGPGLAGTAVIDLGDGWATEPAEPVERPAGRRHWTVSAAAAACLALLALTMIADKPPPPARLTELARWFEPQAFLLATAGTDTLLVQTHDAITAYDAADGRRRWSLPRVADSIHAAGDLIVLGFSTPEGESTEPQSTSHEAVAVDRMTGQVRWRAPAQVQPVGDVLLAFSGDPARPAVEVRDLATYAPRWRVSARSFAVDGWGSGLWELTGDGQLVEHDLATGAVRRRTRIGLPDGTRMTVLTSRDAVGIIGYRFDADGFEQVAGVRWYARDGLGPVGGEHRWIGEYDCGAGTSCAYPADQATPYLIDSATGAPIRPLAPDTAHVGSAAGLLLFGSGRVGSAATGRLEPAGGRLRTDVAGWRVLSTTGQVARLLGHEDHDPFATHLAELTADGLRPLGREPHGLVQCATVPRAAACTTTSGDVVIWRIGEERP
ncbi:outer membrane protein assembly factor BamB family protein [Catellatospora coxensis]|uniref:Pyrrolo-quinoline quinone repeat domain-containing protein n=1 Tax=Catellatospora coxensis TaxID=310354 RepID=A0A8J3L9Y7_9ACTN|nr:PQQ-binding-like beta-propeller repeat protein [Catellatospora coxensis]GIG10750.1 hypothetical protein Cco03nite_74500 [Catellatospora coxensis]